MTSPGTPTRRGPRPGDEGGPPAAARPAPRPAPRPRTWLPRARSARSAPSTSLSTGKWPQAALASQASGGSHPWRRDGSRARAALAALIAVAVLAAVLALVYRWPGSAPGPAPPRPGVRFAVPAVPPGTPAPTGSVLFVAAGAAPGGDGSEARPFATIPEALQRAGPGDSVLVGAGTYRMTVTTVRPGLPGAPIRIVGAGARLVGEGDGRLVQILHDHVTLEAFDISGADILVWVFGATGVRILGNALHDSLGECVRFKYRATGNELAGNRIEACGREGFDLARGKKNGEGVYIGTAPEQLDRNPTPEPDASTGNWVHDNVISVPAECVDVKEASVGNVVEHNTCTGGRDPEGAGFSSRGRGTVFLANVSTGQAGAGIRLGGDGRYDGTQSAVMGNELSGNGGYGLKVQRHPQGPLCSNEVPGNGSGPTNGILDPTTSC